jgi:hypothetical protein
MHYELDLELIKSQIDYSRFKGILDDCSEFHGPMGKEHYKLLSYLSMQFNGATIIDIGTHRGSSALALSYNPTNTVYTFDIMDKVVHTGIKARENIVFSMDNLFSDEGMIKWQEKILEAPFIFMDVDPHNGIMEIDMYALLKSIGYKGFVICDDIWYFKEMRNHFWYRVPFAERYDVTHLGHWSGTGIISFGDDTFPKPDNSDWTLVTAYFDLTKCPDASDEIRKRGSDHYLSHAFSTMALPYNLVVYCEPENVGKLRELRPKHLWEKTRYIECTFDDIRFKKNGVELEESFADYRRKIQQNRLDKPYAFDNRNTASYYLFCMSRYMMLKEVTERNEFGSTHFAWINICIERMGYKNVQRLDEALAVKRDKFSTCYIDYVPESIIKNTAEYFQRGRCGMCSGFFTGNGPNMYRACDLVENKFLEYLEAGYGHADEQLFSPVYFENKDLFEHYYGDYQQMITNYAFIYEAAEPPIYNFVRNSYRCGDKAKCKEACQFVWRSIEQGKVTCDPKFMNELQTYMRLVG